MPRVLSWLHVSDFHFKAEDPADQEFILDALIRDVGNFRKAGRRPDVIFATGDVANSGQLAEYDRAEIFFCSLLQAAGFDPTSDRDRLVVIPGNHDVRRDAVPAGLARTLLNQDEAFKYFGGRSRPVHLGGQQAFWDWHARFFHNVRQWPDYSTCSAFTLRHVQGLRVGVIAINSALFCLDDNDYNKLWIGRKCLKSALAAFQSGDIDVAIALIHHPLEWINDDERPQIIGALSENVDLVLRGHLHDSDAEVVASTTQRMLRVSAGACYQTMRWPSKALYGRLEYDTGRVSIFPIRYEDKIERWVRDGSFFHQPGMEELTFEMKWKRGPVLPATSKPLIDLKVEPAAPYRRPEMIPQNDVVVLGRESLLDDILKRLQSGQDVALFGSSGMGKTAVAMEAAARIRGSFPGGILWAGLGSDPDVLAHLGLWASELWVEAAEVAALKDSERLERIRAAVGQRRTLIVIDDVKSLQIAKSLRILGGAFTHLLTSTEPEVARGFAREGAIEIQPLTPAVATRMLLELMATGAPPKFLPDALEQIVIHTGGVPLAITLAGKYLKETASADSVADLEETLAMQHVASATAGGSSVPAELLAVIEACASAAGEVARRALARLAVFPPKPNTFDEGAAVAVIDSDEETLATLEHYGLLEASDGRWSIHQSVSTYGSTLLRENPPLESIAQDRLVRHMVPYVQVNTKNYKSLFLELRNIFKALEFASRLSLRQQLVDGVIALYPFLETRGLTAREDVQAHLREAAKAAAVLENSEQLAAVLMRLGKAAEKGGQYASAEEYLTKSLALVQQEGRLERIAELLHILGIVSFNRAQYREAEQHLSKGLKIAKYLKDRALYCHLLQRISLVAFSLGEDSRALACAENGLALARETPYGKLLRALLSTDLGRISLKREQYAQAQFYGSEGLKLAKELNNEEVIASAKQVLSRVAIEHGDLSKAESLLEESVAAAVKINHVWYQAFLQHELGKLHIRQRKCASAFKAFDEALAIARSIEARDLEGVALYGLGRVAAAESKHDDAYDHCLRGLQVLHEIGHYKVNEVRRWLATHLVEWAETLMRQGGHERALELLAQASSFCSAREEALLSIHHRISQLQRQTATGDNKNASAAFDDWLAVAPWQLDDFGCLAD